MDEKIFLRKSLTGYTIRIQKQDDINIQSKSHTFLSSRNLFQVRRRKNIVCRMQKWGGKRVISHRTEHSKGVCILVNPTTYQLSKPIPKGDT